MDVVFFLEERVAFILRHYALVGEPFTEIKRRIEAKEPPFVPQYEEEDEPAFLQDWLDADESLQVLAYSCVSMLSASLQLFFKTWVEKSRVAIDSHERTKKGWFGRYKDHFRDNFQIDFDAVSANFGVLDEVVLARNRIEHPSSITTQRIRYEPLDMVKLQRPIFVREYECDVDEEDSIISSTLHISRDQLLFAANETTRFARWFDEQMRAI